MGAVGTAFERRVRLDIQVAQRGNAPKRLDWIHERLKPKVSVGESTRNLVRTTN